MCTHDVHVCREFARPSEAIWGEIVDAQVVDGWIHFDETIVDGESIARLLQRPDQVSFECLTPIPEDRRSLPMRM